MRFCHRHDHPFDRNYGRDCSFCLEEGRAPRTPSVEFIKARNGRWVRADGKKRSAAKP